MDLLRKAIEETNAFCRKLGIRMEKVLQVKGLARVKLLDDAVEAILVNDETKRKLRLLIEQMLDRLPPAYTPGVYEHACERAYLHVHDCYYGEGKSVYSLSPPRPSYIGRDHRR